MPSSYGPGANNVQARSLYPAARGNSTAAVASAATAPAPNDNAPGTMKPGAQSQVDMAFITSARGRPIVALFILILLLVTLKFVGQHVAKPDDGLGGIKVTFYNVMVISLAAVIGIPVYKLLASFKPIPGLTAWIFAA
jgi:hypothetical protein